jgi:hypothetical protein
MLCGVRRSVALGEAVAANQRHGKGTVPFAGGSVGGADTNVRSYSMKTFVSAFALALALAFTGPAFAQDDVTKATDKASCEKAGGMWDDAAKKCSKKM